MIRGRSRVRARGKAASGRKRRQKEKSPRDEKDKEREKGPQTTTPHTSVVTHPLGPSHTMFAITDTRVQFKMGSKKWDLAARGK